MAATRAQCPAMAAMPALQKHPQAAAFPGSARSASAPFSRGRHCWGRAELCHGASAPSIALRTSHPARKAIVLAAAAAAAPALAAASSSSLPAVLQSYGVFILCLAAAICLVSAIPALWAAARLAHRAEAVMSIVERELPDLAASMRLSGLEITDCIRWRGEGLGRGRA
jgi:hypothetical protein